MSKVGPGLWAVTARPLARDEPRRGCEAAAETAGGAVDQRLGDGSAAVYGEDPENGFPPSTGRAEVFREHRDIQLKTGNHEGAEITDFYDSMIAQIVVHKTTRKDACEKLARGCAETDSYPAEANATFLWRALGNPDFRAAGIDTGLIAAKGGPLLGAAEPTEDVMRQAAAAILVQENYGRPTMLSSWDDDLLSQRQSNPSPPGLSFRLNASPNAVVTVTVEDLLHLTTLPEHSHLKPIVEELVVGGVAANDDGLSFLVPLPCISDAPCRGGGAHLSPGPGPIIAVEVAAGDAVTKGQKLLTLEAMKIEHDLVAPFDDVVAELGAAPGPRVSEWRLLVRVDRGCANPIVVLNWLQHDGNEHDGERI